VNDDDGRPVVGSWEPIIDPVTWQSIDAIVQARKGRSVGPDGSPGDVLTADFAEHRYLLSGIARCGKPMPDGSLCGAPLRARWFGGAGKVFHYVCQPRSQGGCAGICRRGAECDRFISEAVLAKLEQQELQVAGSSGDRSVSHPALSLQRER
jgi:hypothetical protein